jgi:DNA-binding response OmpR family regulator
VEDVGRLPAPPPEPDPSSVVVFASAREVRRGGEVVPFTRIEFDLLMFLATHPRQVFTREQLLHHVWGFSRGGLRTVDVHIRRLRAKLPDRPLVVTVRGVGYRLADDADVRVVHLPPPVR